MIKGTWTDSQRSFLLYHSALQNSFPKNRSKDTICFQRSQREEEAGMEEPIDQICWDGLDCCIMEDASEFFQWSFPSGSATMDVSLMSSGPKEQGLKRAREQDKVQTPASSKACREKQRRDKLNEMFSEINSILHPEKPEKADKSAILTEAMSAVTKLRAEAQELKQKKLKLQDEVKNLKAEKAELYDDKHQLKANKQKMEQQLKGSAVTMPSKVMGYSNYLGYPMWQMISPGVLDTSHDHVLRPPVA